MFTVNRNPGKKEIRGFGLAMLLGFGVIGLILWIHSAIRSGADFFLAFAGTENQVWALGLWLLGAVVCALSLRWQRAGRILYLVWMSAAVPIGIAMSTLLLTVLFFLFLPPFAVIVKRTDPLRRRMGGDSYWEDYPRHEATLERLRRAF